MSNTAAGKRLFIIDGSSVFYRAFHAIPATLTSTTGMPTNAVYGFTQTLRKIIAEYAPEYIAVAFDSRGPSFRHEQFEGYKAERPSMPDELSVQIPYIKRVVESLGVPVLEKQSFEADDIIATIDRRVDGTGVKVVMITGDKDMYQLIDDDTVILDYNTGREFGVTEVEEKFGVGPHQIRDLLSLAGDSSDGIPGVPGVGPKTAVKLLKEFGSFDGIYENIDSVKAARLRDKLAEFRAQAEMSRSLATLHADVPVDCDLETLRQMPADTETLASLFTELGFTRLLKEVTSNAASGGAPGASAEVECTPVKTAGELRAVVDLLREAGAFSIVIYTEGEGMWATLRAVAVSTGTGSAFVLEVGEGGMSPDEAASVMKGIFEDGGVAKLTDDSKAFHLQMKRLGVEPRGVVLDTSLASYLLAPSRSEHGIEAVSLEYLGSVIGGGGGGGGRKGRKGGAEPCDTGMLAAKACVINEVADILNTRLQSDGLLPLYLDMELPLARILAGMEYLGVRVEAGTLRELSGEMEIELQRLEADIYSCAGMEFNINSPKQLSTVLFEKLGLKPVKKTKTGFSTDEEVLKRLSVAHEVPGLILSYRTEAKLKSTYVDAITELVNPETGRVHTSFNQTVTATGRLSSSRPNLQNIPIRGEKASRIRSAFVAGQGYSLLSSDYSQIELRIVAHLSEDPSLIESFTLDEDIHTRTASEIFDVAPGLVTGEQRRRAKAINFGIIYGMGAYGLSSELDISAREAEEYIASYFAHYSRVRDFIDETVEGARTTGYTTTIFGRRRYIPELQSPIEQVRRFGARMAINTPVQGAAADIIKVAMIRIDRALADGGYRSRMLLQIHDELFFEAADGEEERLSAMVRTEMERVVTLKVPIRVNIKTGPDWSAVD